MNQKSNNLLLRILTSIVLIIFVLWGLFSLPLVSFGVVTAFIMMLAAAEWPQIIGKPGAFNSLLFVCGLILVLGFGLVLVEINAMANWTRTIVICFSVLFWLWLFKWVLFYQKYQRLPIQSTVLNIIIGYILLFLGWFGLNSIRHFQDGTFLILFFLLLIWGSDTTAYFIGKRWGKAKLIPKVSPNKTWAGAYAALIYSIVLGVLAAVYFPYSPIQRLGLIPIALIVCIFSVIGDLTISAYKRNYHIKDTGKLLPGHGGVFDRLDSLIAAAPIFALGLIILGLK